MDNWLYSSLLLKLLLLLRWRRHKWRAWTYSPKYSKNAIWMIDAYLLTLPLPPLISLLSFPPLLLALLLDEEEDEDKSWFKKLLLLLEGIISASSHDSTYRNASERETIMDGGGLLRGWVFIWSIWAVIVAICQSNGVAYNRRKILTWFILAFGFCKRVLKRAEIQLWRSKISNF